MKPERERMVCRGFLRCLGVQFQEDEILAPYTEPIDVAFRSANFQIRELMEPNRKRGDELKEFQHTVQNATSLEDVMTPCSPPRSISFQKLVNEVTDALVEKVAKYGKGCMDLALVYIDLEQRYLDAKSNMPTLSRLQSQGWRSVSALFPPYSVVFLADPKAPDFVLTNSGQALSRWGDWDTLFDKI
jgi:Putative endonuclease, protein of unknown function (DUF1780)